MHESNFIKQHLKLLWFKITKLLTAVKNINLPRYLLEFSADFRSLWTTSTCVQSSGIIHEAEDY